MGFWQQFPYLNTQGLNLDWIMRTMRTLGDAYDGLKDEIQETIDFVNNFEKHADELIDERITVALSQYTLHLQNIDKELQAIWDELNRDDGVAGQIKELDEKIGDLQNQINSLHHMINDKILDLYELMHQYKHDIDNIIDGKAQELEQYVYSIVTKIDRLDVISPINGLLENVQDVLNEMWSVVSRSYAVTAEQYDSLKLSAHEYDAIRITAQDYDTRSYFHLYMKLTFSLVRSPFTGGMVSFQSIVDSLSNLHKCAITAQEYDNLQITAESYDLMELTAYSYDWFGFVVAKPITAKNYDDLKLFAQAYDDMLITAKRYSQGMGALITTELSGCSNPCGDYQVLAGQITEMSARISDLQEEVDKLEPITVSAGTSYVGMVDFGSINSFVSIPSLADDALVSINAGADILPTVINVEPHRGVSTVWPTDATKVSSLSYVVGVSNKK